MPAIKQSGHIVQPRHDAGERRLCRHPDCQRKPLRVEVREAMARLEQMYREAK